MALGKASMKVFRRAYFLLFASLILLLASCASTKRIHLTDLSTKESQAETELILTTSGPVYINKTKLDNPPSLLITFPGSKVFSHENEESIISKGPILKIKCEYYSEENQSPRRLQFILVELTQETAYQVSKDGNSTIIRLKNPDTAPDPSSPERIQIELQSQEGKEEDLPAGAGYLIGPEDVLNVEVWNQPDISREVIVNYEGEITIPPIKKLSVMGLTVSQLEEKLAEALSRYLIDPIVFVTIKEFNSQRVTALGEIRTGMYTLKRRTTLVEFLGQIGGPTDNADTYHIRLIKKDKKVFVYDFNELLKDPQKSKSVIVTGGDTVYVPPLEFNKVLVVGEVKNPSIVPIKGRLSLLDAITEAGGYTRDAVLKSIIVIRGELGSQEGIRINLNEILKKADLSQNIELQSGDIVYVPTTFIVHIERFLRAVAYPLTWYFWFIY
jgi:polysaccharide export outer membrane protein